mmetsp:Transcript_105483/g.251285  ORF Transcript_105483/g.251285 Transcript_105483/m.251285 type:complete len:634 (-) Transcript_105483:1168-3069(-)
MGCKGHAGQMLRLRGAVEGVAPAQQRGDVVKTHPENLMLLTPAAHLAIDRHQVPVVRQQRLLDFPGILVRRELLDPTELQVHAQHLVLHGLLRLAPGGEHGAGDVPDPDLRHLNLVHCARMHLQLTLCHSVLRDHQRTGTLLDEQLIGPKGLGVRVLGQHVPSGAFCLPVRQIGLFHLTHFGWARQEPHRHVVRHLDHGIHAEDHQQGLFDLGDHAVPHEASGLALGLGFSQDGGAVEVIGAQVGVHAVDLILLEPPRDGGSPHDLHRLKPVTDPAPLCPQSHGLQVGRLERLGQQKAVVFVLPLFPGLILRRRCPMLLRRVLPPGWPAQFRAVGGRRGWDGAPPTVPAHRDSSLLHHREAGMLDLPAQQLPRSLLHRPGRPLWQDVLRRLKIHVVARQAHFWIGQGHQKAQLVNKGLVAGHVQPEEGVVAPEPGGDHGAVLNSHGVVGDVEVEEVVIVREHIGEHLGRAAVLGTGAQAVPAQVHARQPAAAGPVVIEALQKLERPQAVEAVPVQVQHAQELQVADHGPQHLAQLVIHPAKPVLRQAQGPQLGGTGGQRADKVAEVPLVRVRHHARAEWRAQAVALQIQLQERRHRDLPQGRLKVTDALLPDEVLREVQSLCLWQQLLADDGH